MITLAISTSSNACSVALLDDDKLIKELNIIDEKTHSEKLLPLIDELLKQTNTEISSINLIACDNGPRLFYRYSYRNFACKRHGRGIKYSCNHLNIFGSFEFQCTGQNYMFSNRCKKQSSLCRTFWF